MINVRREGFARLRALWLGMLTLFGCTEEPITQVFVNIDAEPKVLAATDSLRIQVEGGNGFDDLPESRVTRMEETLKPATFPLRLSLVPLDGMASRAFIVTATALKEGGVVAEGRLVSGYLEGQVRYGRLLLEDTCLGAARCEALDTCSNSMCISALVEPGNLTSAASEPDYASAGTNACSGDACNDCSSGEKVCGEECISADGCCGDTECSAGLPGNGATTPAMAVDRAEDGAAGDDGAAGSTDPGDEQCDLTAATEEDTVPETIDGEVTLTSDKVWVLEKTSYVEDGGVLTIEPCTRVVGTGSESVLVVTRGGKIQADGEADAPIVFTSASAEGDRGPGQWGGLVILGRAPNFDINAASIDETDPEKAGVLIEGLAPSDARNYHGGDVADDDSGVLSYVRIEYSGIDLGGGNEINGLSLGSVGSKTVIDHVMINTTLDDCFEWFGGTVNASYLICNNGGDDMFDADVGYQGTIEYLFGRQVEPHSEDPNGFEMDSDKDNDAEPHTTVIASHATFCGAEATATTRAMVLRENLRGAIDDVLATGFAHGVDTRDEFGTPEDPRVTLTNANFWGMTESLYEEEPDMPEAESNPNDDNGFDEQAYFENGEGNSSLTGPFTVAQCGSSTGPAAAVVYSRLGAFSGNDWNLDGQWVNWEIH